MDAGHFLKLNRQEFDRLMETSPSIPTKIISDFNTTFAGKPGTDQRKRFDELKKPDICDIIVTANENRHQWYKNINTQTFDILDNADELKLRESMIQTKVDEIVRKEREEKQRLKEREARDKMENEKQLAEMAIELANKMNKEHMKIDDFVNAFESMHGRKPISDEISRNFIIEIDEDVIKKYLDKYVGSIENV
jgi:FKBP-type peptidyl-prolyl cis-trans isomerase (trigger factor)